MKKASIFLLVTMAFALNCIGASHGLSMKFELLLRDFERENFRMVLKEAREEGFKISGFYHLSDWQPYWREVVEEQIMLLQGRHRIANKGRKDKDHSMTNSGNYSWTPPHSPSLLDVVDHVHVNVGGSYENYTQIKSFISSLFQPSYPQSSSTSVPLSAVSPREASHLKKLMTTWNETVRRNFYHQANDTQKTQLLKQVGKISSGEMSTLLRLQDYCVEMNGQGKKALVYYFHNKGSCCTYEHGPKDWHAGVTSWRDIMNTFTIEFPSICIKALMLGYSNCGSLFQGHIFQGNFFWSRCDHIALLPSLRENKDLLFKPWEAENFIFNVSSWREQKEIWGLVCAYSPLTVNFDLYYNQLPRSEYRHLLLSLLAQSVEKKFLPPNPSIPDLPVNSSLDFMNQVCTQMRKSGLYEQQPGFLQWEKFSIKTLSHTK